MSELKFPRRAKLQEHTAAELAIHKAIQEVEKAGADPRLTDAVILLTQAKDKVSDFVDGINEAEPAPVYVPTSQPENRTELL